MMNWYFERFMTGSFIEVNQVSNFILPTSFIVACNCHEAIFFSGEASGHAGHAEHDQKYS